MTPDHARRLLDRVEVLRHPCDLDFLIFFARHPLALLASEQLAILLGYEFTRLAASLDVLQRADLVTLSETPPYQAHARMYVFTAGDANVGWLADLLQLASTRDGRLALVAALKERSAGEKGGPTARA